ncbi:uncharacterized protein CDAR_318231 [Caerostris darwini]|uniref:Uncharacterized protein n=1 Tax=Caerostris darwini TaxID=1538125 RepID=A0AAV4TAW4_9ARAC|nr:uncharacterized protein CDAR_318231 [Caerostris darwini]
MDNNFEESGVTDVQTVKPVTNWIISPTLSPTGISHHQSYLYVSTIVLAIVIIGTAILVILRACYRACIISNCTIYPSPAEVPIITGFRPTMVPTDAILINGRFLPDDDKPPSYSSVAQVYEINESSETQLLIKSETPPPSYQSIV